MTRRMCLLLISLLLSMMGNPIFLSASDQVQVSDLNPSKIVEMVPLPEPEPEPEAEIVDDDTVSYAASQSIVHVAPVAEAVVPANAISVVGRVIPIVDVADTAIDAGGHVNKYGDKFLYGHNSAAVFGDLVYLGVGSVFMVSYAGVTSTYQVNEVQIFEKTSATTLSSNGLNYRMSAIVNGKGRYDMVLMTCYGTMYGNGDASHRLVVFANRV